MLRIQFDREDLGRVRIARGADPMWELVLSLFRLRRPEGRLVFDAWRRHTWRRVPSNSTLLTDLVPPAGNFADFLTPVTSSGTMAASVEAILGTASREVTSDFDDAHEGSARAAVVQHARQ